ncbi:MAG: hypothetical protein HN929_11875 [Chloroflexi bacterium]|jgi:hypothetical protein|nr:hypothetical protein [Candidatus Parcubacteria bacterium]MBT7082137.1 hypothetical protein [Chloroflexota bacterium]
MAKDPGTIKRLPDGTVKVRAQNMSPGILKWPGVQCENPDAPEAERYYFKIFTDKTVYLPDEYEQAVREVLRSGKDIVVLAGNGYSDINPQRCADWGIKQGAYEEASFALLDNAYQRLREQLTGIDIRIAHGASHMGIDLVLMRLAEKYNIPQLGHSCVRYMFYVQDDDIPVWVGNDVDHYVEGFTDSLDVLVSANGALQSYRMDVKAVFEKGKHWIPLNVLQAISTTGGPPAMDADGKIVDAVALFYQRVHMITVQMGVVGEDHWLSMVDKTSTTLVSICRNLISPQRAFMT